VQKVLLVACCNRKAPARSNGCNLYIRHVYLKASFLRSRRYLGVAHRGQMIEREWIQNGEEKPLRKQRYLASSPALRQACYTIPDLASLIAVVRKDESGKSVEPIQDGFDWKRPH